MYEIGVAHSGWILIVSFFLIAVVGRGPCTPAEIQPVSCSTSLYKEKISVALLVVAHEVLAEYWLGWLQVVTESSLPGASLS
jgi:hypothetical protein